MVKTKALYELVQPNQDRVYAATFVIWCYSTDAEDCAQEAVLKAHKYIGRSTASRGLAFSSCRLP